MTTPLTNFDTRYAFMCLRFVYLYDYKLSEDILNKGLQKLLQRYPQLTGVLQECKQKTSKCAKLEIKHGKPSDVKIVVSEYKGDVSDYKEWAEEDANGEVKKEHDELLMQFVDLQETGFPYLCGKPVFRVKLTHLPNNCSVLGVSVNHAVVDAQSYFDLMTAWAQFATLPEEKVDQKYLHPNHQRENLMRVSKDYKERVISKEQLIKNGMYYDRDMKSLQALMQKKFTQRSIDFSPEDIQKLKQDARSGKAKDKLKIVSTNDVVCCHMWKVLSMLRTGASDDRKEDTIFPVLIQCNFRKVWKAIDERYFGNAVTYIVLEATKKELAESDLSQLVFRMRDSIQNFSEQDVQDVIDNLERNETPFPKVPVDPYHGLLITSWAKYDLLNVDFGKGKPFRAYCPVGGGPAGAWLARILPISKGGVSFKVFVDEDVLRKMDTLQNTNLLNSTAAYQKIICM